MIFSILATIDSSFWPRIWFGALFFWVAIAFVGSFLPRFLAVLCAYIAFAFFCLFVFASFKCCQMPEVHDEWIQENLLDDF